ncbi:MAG: hypothetical protein ACR2MB_11840 [Acidimicrobiales bacterium]
MPEGNRRDPPTPPEIVGLVVVLALDFLAGVLLPAIAAILVMAAITGIYVGLVAQRRKGN